MKHNTHPPHSLTHTQAEQLGKRLQLFSEATSLGGVESLVDWRYRYDTTVPASLVRLSIGLEEPADLISDFTQALNSIQ